VLLGNSNEYLALDHHCLTVKTPDSRECAEFQFHRIRYAGEKKKERKQARLPLVARGPFIDKYIHTSKVRGRLYITRFNLSSIR
jgi:hypothetical protein